MPRRQRGDAHHASVSNAAGFVAALLSALTPSLAAGNDDIITRWYSMLVAANEDGLASLLSDKVVIKLEDIGITQNKTEFLGTMGEWRIAIAGGGIRHKVEKTEGDVDDRARLLRFCRERHTDPRDVQDRRRADRREHAEPASPRTATPIEIMPGGELKTCGLGIS